MQPVARMSLAGNSVEVEITDRSIGALSEVVYVWTTANGDWLRVGTSAAPVAKRLLNYAKHISRSLQGISEKPTPRHEAEQWKALLESEGPLIALAHQPPTVSTIAGELRPFLDIERELIRAKKPRLNRSHR